jgi:hypothetical protein
MIEFMRGYVKGSGHPLTKNIATNADDDVAHSIDSVRHKVDLGRSREGFRWYLWKEKDQTALKSTNRKPVKKGNQYNAKGRLESYTHDYNFKGQAKVKVHALVEEHIREILHFCDYLEKRLDNVSRDDWTKPLRYPLVEVGYSNRSIKRLENHSAHIGSNYVMNLMESIADVIHHHLNGDFFCIEQAIIYLIWMPEQAEIAEIGWTKLAEGYTGNGGGFSHYPAGRSNYSAQTTHSTEWSYAKQAALTGSPLCSNLNRLVKELKEAEEDAEKQKQDALHNAAEIAAMRKEIHENLLKLHAASATHEERLQSILLQTHQVAERIRVSQRSQIYSHSQLYAEIIKGILWRKNDFAIEQLQPTLRDMFEKIAMTGQAPSVREQLSEDRPSSRLGSEERWGKSTGPSQLGPRR